MKTFCFRSLATFLRRTRAATRIQAKWRGFVALRAYMRTLAAIRTIQSYIRGMFARRLYYVLRRKVAATTIQVRILHVAFRAFAQQYVGTMWTCLNFAEIYSRLAGSVPLQERTASGHLPAVLRA